MYKAALFALDGDWVTDFSSDTKEEVREKLADRGSRWFFYPIDAIIKHKGNVTNGRQRILEIPEPFEHLIGRSIRTASNFFKNTPEVAQIFG